MTKKDYKLIAEAISLTVSSGNPDRSFLIETLCASLKRDNPKFLADKFREACQPSQGAAPSWLPPRRD
jgi:hypothetical protein